MSNQIARFDKSFHSYFDTPTSFKPGFLVTPQSKDFIISKDDVSYRFYPHFHPYVKQLTQRLLKSSTAGLQAMDTEYRIQISLSNSITGKYSDGKQVTLAGGEKIDLLEGTTMTLANGHLVKFTGSKLVDQDERIIVTLPTNTAVTIKPQAVIRCINGQRVIANNEINGALTTGNPRPILYEEIFSSTKYDPDSSLVQQPYPVKDLDFTSSGAYGVYNWELFFHVPLTIAIHLSKNQRFAEAQRWFHYLFNPTDDSDGPTPERFWKVRPFQSTEVKKIEDILVNLSTSADRALQSETINSIEAWKAAPFRPHVIARYRPQAYMYKTVMAYLDNLIAWGDSLFRQDTGEAIDESLMLYVLAASILGPRPQVVPKKGSVRPQTYANLQSDLKQFGSVMRDMEAAVPFDLSPFPTDTSDSHEGLITTRSIGKALYFCVPRNDKLLGYWDTIADRLFKIHNSLNFQGVFRQLALFEPPIDPAMLARAAAAGLDVGTIVNGLNQPLPLVRFQLLVQKAAEIVQEVKSLGNNLLSAMEKEDGEAMAILRAKHERVVMEMVEQVRYSQLQEAIKSKEGLFQSLALAVQRHTYYEKQLGKKDDEISKSIPKLDELTQDEKDSLAKLNFKVVEPAMDNLREINVDISQDLGASGGKIISSYEAEEMDKLGQARTIQEVVQGIMLTAQGIRTLPDFGTKFHFWGLGGDMKLGGTTLGEVLSYGAEISKAVGERFTYDAGNAAKIGGYARREQDWIFQSNLAAGEITQIFKQLRAAQIREAIAELELRNHRQQITNAKEIEQFLNSEGTEKSGKKTNQALYAWMKREVKGLYSQCFQFAFDIAKKAERALQHELGNPERSYLQFGYLAGKEGLLAGEKLYLDVKRMEMGYHDLNQREYELTKHVSLLQVDPLALIKLRTTGRCTIKLPEALFDMDGPGHYFRRIKTVALSIPCVTGPYASVNCTLTLLKSSIRKTQALHDDIYAREDAEDDRFNDYFGSLQSIVTSSAQNDSGLFETNLRDERYLPFENSGVISEWQLELPANPSKDDPQQFDYDTISDVILHIRYTAREGGGLLRKGAIDSLKTATDTPETGGWVRLFSVRHEFPTEWAKFQSQTSASNANLKLDLKPEHYPFWSQKYLNSFKNITVLARSKKNSSIKVDGFSLNKNADLGNLLFINLDKSSLRDKSFVKPTGQLTLSFSNDVNTLTDLWIAITWSK